MLPKCFEYGIKNKIEMPLFTFAHLPFSFPHSISRLAEVGVFSHPTTK